MKNNIKLIIFIYLFIYNNIFFAANDASTTMTSAVEFVKTINMGSVTELSFGDILTSISNTETIIVNSSGLVTGTGALTRYIGNAVNGSIPITAHPAAIDCYINNISAANSAKFIINNPRCNYNNTGETNCTSASKHTFTPPNFNINTLAYGLTLTKQATVVSNENLRENIDIVCDYQ